MKDLIPLGTGNSRFLKSAIPEDITFAQLVQLLRSGAFPFDFNGINPAGISQMGSAYSVANVLPEDVCAALDIPTTSEPKDAFNILALLLKTAPVLLQSFTSSAAARTVSMDVDVTSWPNYDYMMLIGNGSTSNPKAEMVLIQLDDGQDLTEQSLMSASGMFREFNSLNTARNAVGQTGLNMGNFCVIMPIFQNLQNSMSAHTFSTSNYDAGYSIGGFSDHIYANLQSINFMTFQTSNTISAGLNVKVYGVKLV